MVTTAALALLVIVLIAAAFFRLWAAMATAVGAMLVFNYFFLAPVGTFTIADPQNLMAFAAFAAAAFIGSQLSSIARSRTDDAIRSRNELAQLFDLSRDVLLTGESTGGTEALARCIARRFALPSAALYLSSAHGWRRHQGTEDALVIPDAALDVAMARAGRTLEFDARERAYAGHAEAASSGGVVCAMAPVRHGMTLLGFLVVPAGALRLGALDAVAGLAAIAVEREQLLEERRAADLVRQKADFTSTLLASLSHDLRTPLTAIRVAIDNLDRGGLDEPSRRAQIHLAQTELERLSRLFTDILDMARIESASLTPVREWVTASDVIDAALANLAPLIAGRDLRVVGDDATAVHIDPRLTSSALSHLIENAAQYASAETMIEVSGRVDADGLRLSVRDHGAGLEPAELDRLFERFYRGRRHAETSVGTGMGLAITRGLLAVEGGRVWAENAPGGGACFSIAVPAAARRVMGDS